MELEHYQKIALYGFIGAALFGAITNRTHFCTMGAVSDWINMGSLTRLRVWFLAMGVCLIGAQLLHGNGAIDLTASIYLGTRFTWVGYILGGFLFGIGMTIGSGCGQRTLVRLGNGNLKSLVLLLVMGLTAYMTVRGLFALARLAINDPTALDLATHGLETQGMAEILAHISGLNQTTATIIISTVIGGGALLFALRDRQVWQNFDNLLAGVSIGLLCAAAWYVTGVLGFDDFDPVPLVGFTFVAPVGNTLSYLMTYTGSIINFGIAIVFGVIFGSFLYGIASGSFRLESFNDRADLVNHLVGGVLMGFGGVLALGCTIGQGITGLSTLALGSVIALTAIVCGCVFTLKMQYYLYDEKGWRHAFTATLTDIFSR